MMALRSYADTPHADTPTRFCLAPPPPTPAAPTQSPSDQVKYQMLADRTLARHFN